MGMAGADEKGKGDVSGMGPAASPGWGGPVKYLLVLIVIIGLATYIFMGGPKALTGRAEAAVDRRQNIWDSVARLEAQRRDMLIRAKGRLGTSSPASGASRRGGYAAGYRDGFGQGYFEGSFLAGNTKPNPLFFAVPHP